MGPSTYGVLRRGKAFTFNDPDAVAVVPGGNTAYVVDQGLYGDVTPVNLASGTVGAPLPVGQVPVAIAIAPGGKTICVANYLSNTVSIIDPENHKENATIPGLSRPNAIAITPNGKTAYVTNFQSQTVMAIDIQSHSVVGPVGKPNEFSRPVDIAVKGDLGFVSDQGNGYVTVFDLKSPSIYSRISVSGLPGAIAITPNGKFALVTNQYDLVSVISIGNSPSTTKIVNQVHVYERPVSIAVSPNGAEAYVAGYTSGSVTPVALYSSPNRDSPGTAVYTWQPPSTRYPNGVVPGPMAIAVNHKGTALYVFNFHTGAIKTIKLPMQ